MEYVKPALTETTMEKLLESDGFLIAMLGAESNRRYLRAISQWDIGAYQKGVLTSLSVLEDQKVTSQKQLAACTGIDPRNLVAILDSLEARALVERVPNAEDRRRSGITLTAEGKKIAQQLCAVGQKLEENMFACLNKQEKVTLHRLLLKLYKDTVGGISHNE